MARNVGGTPPPRSHPRPRSFRPSCLCSRPSLCPCHPRRTLHSHRTIRPRPVCAVRQQHPSTTPCAGWSRRPRLTYAAHEQRPTHTGQTGSDTYARVVSEHRSTYPGMPTVTSPPAPPSSHPPSPRPRIHRTSASSSVRTPSTSIATNPPAPSMNIARRARQS